MSHVRVYGRAHGNSSHARVTQGFVRALEGAELLAGVMELDREPLPDELPPPGALAPHAVFTGRLGLVPCTRQNARHDRVWVMVAPNSNRVPEQLLPLLSRHATDILVPSKWARDVMVVEQLEAVKYGLISAPLPVTVVPHGVGSGFTMAKEDCERRKESYNQRGEFAVMHFSTSEFQRKGTLLLMQAWERSLVWLPPKAELHLVLDPRAYQCAVEWIADRGQSVPKVIMHARMDLSGTAMASVLRNVHCICQPSRGEGFGMVPLEALACGTPVIATNCTGHQEWATKDSAGVCLVMHGEMAPLDDLPGSMAPSLSVEAIGRALSAMYFDWPKYAAAAEANAEHIQQEWAWERKLAPWLKMVQ